MKAERIYSLFLSVAFVLVAATMAVAHDITIMNRAKLGDGPELQPGTYRVELVKGRDTSEALFYKGKNLVVRVPTKLVQESTKSPHTAVHSEVNDGARVITQIRVAGWRESLVFERTAQNPATTQ